MRQFIFFLCVSWLLVSCNDNDSMLNVPIEQIEFANTGGEQTFTIDCNDDWSMYGLPSWLNASRQSGINTQEVTLTAPENNTRLDREQIVMVRTNDSKNVQTFNVLQYAYPEGPVFAVDDCSVRYFSGSNSLEFDDSILIKSSAKWRINGPEWLAMQFKEKNYFLVGDLFEGSGTINLRSYRDNTSEEIRKDTVTIQKDKSETSFKIPVVQLGINDIMCKNIHVQSDGIWTEFRYGNGMEYIEYGIIEGVVSAEQVVDQNWKGFVSKDAVTGFSDLKPNTDYTICMRKKISDNVSADKVNVEVIHTPTDNNQPRVTIEYLGEQDGLWYFSLTMNQFAKGYYFVNIYDDLNKVEYEYSMYKMIESGDLTYHNTDGYGWINQDDAVTILVWAVGEDGRLSNVVDMYKKVPNTASASMRQASPKLEYVGTFKLENVNIEELVPLNSNNKE